MVGADSPQFFKDTEPFIVHPGDALGSRLELPEGSITPNRPGVCRQPAGEVRPPGGRPAGSPRWRTGVVDNAKWTGVPLAHVRGEAGNVLIGEVSPTPQAVIADLGGARRVTLRITEPGAGGVHRRVTSTEVTHQAMPSPTAASHTASSPESNHSSQASP